MQNYYDADKTWQASYRISNKEEYLEKYLVKGYFHKSVPNNVKEAFVTVEYLLAHAYYHYNMYEESFHVALRLLEKSIKLRAVELGIDLKDKPKKDGSRFDKKISTLTKEVAKTLKSDLLYDRLDKTRMIRNSITHSKEAPFIGTNGNIDYQLKHIVLVINELFQDKDWHINYQKTLSEIEGKINILNKKLFSFELNGRYITNGFCLVDIFYKSLIIAIKPVAELNEKNKFFYSYCLELVKYELSENSIIGTTLHGEKIVFTETNNRNDISFFKKYKKQINIRDKAFNNMSEDFVKRETIQKFTEIKSQILSRNIFR